MFIVLGLSIVQHKQIGSGGAIIFAVAWILVMAMVLVNMFVAILTEWYLQARHEACDIVGLLQESKRPLPIKKKSEKGLAGPLNHGSLNGSR